MDTIIHFFQTYQPLRHLVVAVLILFVGRWLARRISGFIERAMERTGIEATLTKFTSNMAYIVDLITSKCTYLGSAISPSFMRP